MQKHVVPSSLVINQEVRHSSGEQFGTASLPPRSARILVVLSEGHTLHAQHYYSAAFRASRRGSGETGDSHQSRRGVAGARGPDGRRENSDFFCRGVAPIATTLQRPGRAQHNAASTSALRSVGQSYPCFVRWFPSFSSDT